MQSLYKADNPLLGSLLYLFAYFNIAVIGICVKFLPATVHIGTIIFFQFFIPLLLCLPRIKQEGLISLKSNYYHLHLLRGLSGIVTFTAFFHSLSFISLTNAIVLRSTTPFWIPIILLIWRRTIVSKQLWLSITIGFIGITFIIKPNAYGYSNIGSLFALMSGISIAISTLSIRKLSATEPTQRTLFYFCLIASLASFPFIDTDWEKISASCLLIFISIGVLMYLIEKSLITALQYERASTLAPISYSAIIFSGIFEWLVWNKNLDLYDFLGALLIVFAGMMTLKRNAKIPAINLTSSK